MTVMLAIMKQIHRLQCRCYHRSSLGTTCDGDLTVTGKAQAGVEIDVYIDGALVGTTTANAAGHWSLATTVADGSHSVYAIAKVGGNSSQRTITHGSLQC